MILWVVRLIVGGLFIYAGAVKAFETEEFTREIQRYALIPWPDATLLLALYLPWLELVAGVAVIVRRLQVGALAILLLLMLMFTAALTSAWTRGLDIECGCFGKSKQSIRTNFPGLLARDLAILAGAGLLLAAEWRMLRKTNGRLAGPAR
ncbi:MAG TPA: MauE/DoxX family redox-associated membrane protein [Chthoniobacteraceae bacterium]|jgi:uncharacterized membrane protein YphA (DoxX/SURF4 family)